jgi:hypothetical protein
MDLHGPAQGFHDDPFGHAKEATSVGIPAPALDAPFACATFAQDAFCEGGPMSPILCPEAASEFRSLLILSQRDRHASPPSCC